MGSAFKVIRGMFRFSTIGQNIDEAFRTINVSNFRDAREAIILGIMVLFLFNNSIKKGQRFKSKIFDMIEQLFYFWWSILMLNNISEFLYFNF